MINRLLRTTQNGLTYHPSSCLPCLSFWPDKFIIGPYRLFSFTQWPHFHVNLFYGMSGANKDYIPMFSWTNFVLLFLSSITK
jgi:hypothetical protein